MIPQVAHSFGSKWSNDAEKHWKECACGEKAEAADHVYSSAADASCDVCDYNRTVVHDWKSEYAFDADKHWIECGHCDETKDAEKHTGGEANCSEQAVCSVCGQAYGKLGAHKLVKTEKVEADHTKAGNIEYYTCEICGKLFKDSKGNKEIQLADTVIPQVAHSFGSKWKNDAEKHWKECSCGEKAEIADHIYDGPADATCNECGYKRSVAHSWKTEYAFDANNHWFECEYCGEKNAVTAHNGGKATCTEKAVCADCGQAYGELAACDFTEKKAEEKYLKSVATCAEPAAYYISCSVCGNAGTETFSYGEVDANNHVGETEIRGYVEATCKADGYSGDTYCVACDAKLAEGQILKADHNLTKVEAKAATHEEDGNIEYFTCGTCQKIFADDKGKVELAAADVVIPKEEHTYAPAQDDKEHWNGCECGSRIDVEAHAYGEWTILKEAELDVPGSKERTCAKCGYVETVVIPAINTPATGDRNLALWMILLAASAFGMVVVVTMYPVKKGKYMR